MKMLFCYDGPIEQDCNGEFYSPALNSAMFQRYKAISDDIRIAIRVRKVKEDYSSRKMAGNYLSKKEYKIIESPNISSVKGIFINKRKAKLILEREIKNIDFLIIRLPSMIGNLAVKTAKKYKKPYLIEMVGCPWDALWNHSLKGKLFAPIMTYITKKEIKNAPYVLYVTKDFLQKRYPTNGKSIGCSDVVLNDIDEKNLEIRKDRFKRNKENSIKIIATTAAVDVKYKGQKYVLKAIKRLMNDGKMFEYWLIGDGDNSYLKKYVKKYKLEKQVKFLGPLPHNEVFEKLDNVDIYIQPSKQEGLPRALIEAMSRALLCIGSRTGGIPELLEKKFIFNKGSSKQLAKILKKIDTEDMIEQSLKNFEKSKDYAKNKLDERRIDFYKNFIREYVDR